MPHSIHVLRTVLLTLVSACWLCHAAELSDADLLPLADERAAVRSATWATLAASGDARLLPFIADVTQRSAFTWQGRVVLALEADGDATPLHPLTRAPLSPTALPRDQFADLPLTQRDRQAAGAAKARLRLADPLAANRLDAVLRIGDAGGEANRALLEPIAAHDSDPRVRYAAAEGVALIDLASTDAAARVRGARAIAALASSRASEPLAKLKADADPGVRAAVGDALTAIDRHRMTVRSVQTVFSGLSAGSILIIMALGLAITFGLMGVINMAHGEMLMIGAYATLLVQWFFQWALPPAAMPFAFPLGLVGGFAAAAAVGWLLELTVIRHLYGRPLETLLATIGIGQVLIWTVRDRFGNNQAVTAPTWLTGGWEPMPDLVLPWNRLFIILVTVVAVAAVWLLMNRTRLGLLLRATVQSRRTAASLGVNTRRIDGLTFALGSGLAGSAGCALTLIGGLNPDMGQEYIIDSFLVVAAGGVGNLWGVVCAGLGVGMLTKLMEPWTQTVFAKVIMLGLIILFLQARPQGLFPPRGRLADG